MDLTRTELVEIGLDVIEADTTDRPAGMRERILSAATARPRAALHPGWTSDELSSLDAFITTAAELSRLLDAVSPPEWDVLTSVGDGATVRDLVLHLVGVERYLLGQLGWRDVIDAHRPEQHFPVLRAAAADLDDADGAQIARAWWIEVMELVGACAEVGPDHAVAYHHLAGSVRGSLVVRTFELWTHDDDIRRAVGLPANPLDEARLALMSTALMSSLPIGMALMGTTRPGRSARIELTGADGSSSFDVALSSGEVAGAPDITIEVSITDLCRLAANRMSVDVIPVVVTGDRSLLEPVLVGATAFALD